MKARLSRDLRRGQGADNSGFLPAVGAASGFMHAVLQSGHGIHYAPAGSHYDEL